MLIGVGLGPGDKELLTLKAVRLLKTADKVFVPGRVAKELVSDYVDAEIIDAPMVNNVDVVRSAMEKNADRIAEFALKGTAVLGILGDPSFYSTLSNLFGVLKEKYPEMKITIEPGISSITACASRMGLWISGGFVVSDGPPPDSIILLKVKKPRETMNRLKQEGYTQFMLGEHLFMKDERIFTENEMPKSCNYLSVMFARK